MSCIWVLNLNSRQVSNAIRSVLSVCVCVCLRVCAHLSVCPYVCMCMCVCGCLWLYSRSWRRLDLDNNLSSTETHTCTYSYRKTQVKRNCGLWTDNHEFITIYYHIYTVCIYILYCRFFLLVPSCSRDLAAKSGCFRLFFWSYSVFVSLL